ncbi:hypothetical protein SCHPADRAFT_903369 [Schizopora paradoxa]|uniref:DUF6532 domain-containing protein n=1 Tax=Schizopora paradoxa TaxID=27342 RepID=A0A0H2RS89_9AGAM|nr:hypothetical protein SCHPADRAFT_903369 [Schizopora paradoxa]
MTRHSDKNNGHQHDNRRSRTSCPTVKQQALDEYAENARKRKEERQKKDQHREDVEQAERQREAARRKNPAPASPAVRDSESDDGGDDGEFTPNPDADSSEGDGEELEDDEDDGEENPRRKARRATGTRPIALAKVHVQTTVQSKPKASLRRADEPPRLPTTAPNRQEGSQTHSGPSQSATPMSNSRSEGSGSRGLSETGVSPSSLFEPHERLLEVDSPRRPSVVINEDELEELQKEHKRKRKEKKEKEKRAEKALRKQAESRSSSSKSHKRKRSQTRSRDDDDLNSGTSSDNDSITPHSKRQKERDRSDKDARDKKARPSLSRIPDENTRTLTTTAIPFFSACMVANTPYPSLDEQDQAVADAWGYAEDKKDIKARITRDSRSVILQRCSNVRSDVAQAAREVVSTYFGLGDVEGEDEALAQQEKVSKLRESGTRFLYKDTDDKKFLFQNPALQKVIRKAFFPDTRGLGVIFNKLFNPISAETLALVCTAVDHALEEYSSGSPKKKKFTEQDHFPRYCMYLKTINTFGQACPGALRRILQEMHDTSRGQSGAGAIANVTNLATMDEIARAAAEYDEMGYGDN